MCLLGARRVGEGVGENSEQRPAHRGNEVVKVLEGMVYAVEEFQAVGLVIFSIVVFFVYW